MTDSPQWTSGVSEAVARAMATVDRHRCDTVDEVWRSYLQQTEAALTFLASEGLLLPPGGEVYIEWGFVHRNDRGGSFSSANEAVAQDMFQRAGGNDKARWGIRVATEWPETGGQYHGPWQFSGE